MLSDEKRRLMLTYRLWRALKRPPRNHPLFRRALSGAKDDVPPLTGLAISWLFMCSAFALCGAVIWTAIPLTVLALVTGLNTLMGALWATSIATTIAQAQSRGQMGILGVLPLGPLGVAWALTTGCLHRRSGFFWVPFLVQLMTIILLILLAAGIVITQVVIMNERVGSASQASNQDIIPLAMIAMAFVAGFFFDHTHSVVMACLLGMLAPVDARYSAEVRLRGLLGYLLLQVSQYVLVAVLVTRVLIPLFDLRDLSDGRALLMVCVMALLFFVAMRELVNQALWRTLRWRLNVEEAEERVVFSGA